MTAIDRVTAHFSKIGTRKIVVPEWEGLEIHYTPITVGERKAIYARGEDAESIMVNTIIEKAKDADGKPLFVLEDSARLFQKADATIIQRIASEMFVTAKSKDLGNS